MKDLIKKILKESEDDFEWAEEYIDIDSDFILTKTPNLLNIGDTVMVDGYVDWTGDGHKDSEFNNDVGTIVGMPKFRGNDIMVIYFKEKTFENTIPDYQGFTTPKECESNKCWVIMRDYTKFESCKHLKVYVKKSNINESEDDFGWAEEIVDSDVIPIKKGENYIIDFCEEIVMPDTLRRKFNDLYGKSLVDALINSVDINIMDNQNIQRFVDDKKGFQVIVRHYNDGEPRSTGWNPCTRGSAFTLDYPELKSFTPSEFLKLVFV